MGEDLAFRRFVNFLGTYPTCQSTNITRNQHKLCDHLNCCGSQKRKLYSIQGGRSTQEKKFASSLF